MADAIVHLEVHYDKDLKSFTKHYDYDKTKSFEKQFEEMCQLFEIPQSKVSDHCFQIDKNVSPVSYNASTLPKDSFKSNVSIYFYTLFNICRRQMFTSKFNRHFKHKTFLKQFNRTISQQLTIL